MHGVANLEHRVHYLSDKNGQLTRENAELHEKCKRIEEGAGKGHKGGAGDNERVLTRNLAVAKRTISEKEAEVETLKVQIKQLKS